MSIGDDSCNCNAGEIVGDLTGTYELCSGQNTCNNVPQCVQLVTNGMDRCANDNDCNFPPDLSNCCDANVNCCADASNGDLTNSGYCFKIDNTMKDYSTTCDEAPTPAPV